MNYSIEEAGMPHVKVGPRHQITIPKPVFDELNLEVGDILEVKVDKGKAVITPKRVIAKAPVAKLSSDEQRLLKKAQIKIATIQENLTNAKGLTDPEIAVAVKVGLIDLDQKWWWSETWQKQEREAQKNIEKGTVEKFATADDFLNVLQS